MGQKFTITESERNQIRGLYEQQPTDDTIMGVPISKLGLNPSQVLKDGTGNVIGKFYMGNDGNKGYTVKIMNNSKDAIVFDPIDKGSKTVPLQQMVSDFKSRIHEYTSGMTSNPNTSNPETKFMSDDDVAKLNASIKH